MCKTCTISSFLAVLGGPMTITSNYALPQHALQALARGTLVKISSLTEAGESCHQDLDPALTCRRDCLTKCCWCTPFLRLCHFLLLWGTVSLQKVKSCAPHCILAHLLALGTCLRTTCHMACLTNGSGHIARQHRPACGCGFPNSFLRSSPRPQARWRRSRSVTTFPGTSPARPAPQASSACR